MLGGLVETRLQKTLAHVELERAMESAVPIEQWGQASRIFVRNTRKAIKRSPEKGLDARYGENKVVPASVGR